MAKAEISLQNFAGGELSSDMYGRFNLPVSINGVRRAKNFIIQTPGAGHYRPGFVNVNHTRLNQIANLEEFKFNDEQAYQNEYTNKKLRIFRDNGFILEANKTITAITQANPGVISSAAHSFSDGDEIFLKDIVGMVELNNKTFLVDNSTGGTFEITDIDGNLIDTTSFGAFTSGVDSLARIFELDTPYTEANDLFQLDMDQNADTMYVVHPFYEPRKLTRTDHDAWTLERFTRTNDPFLDKKVITAITLANPGVITSGTHGYIGGETIILEEIVGMVELNSQPYIVVFINANTISLTDLDGNAVDTTGFTAYTSDGFASNTNLLPLTVEFYESRIIYGGPKATPTKINGSRSPDPTTGAIRYDDFTKGGLVTDAFDHTLANANISQIHWLEGTDRFLLAGTEGSVVKITGTESDRALSQDSISSRPVDFTGAADISPVNKDNAIFYVQQGGLTINSLEFELTRSDSLGVEDKNLVSNHLTISGIKQMTWQTGRPDILWALRKDGVLTAYTSKSREQIFAGSRHTTGAIGEDKFTSVSTMSRPTNHQQVWVVTEREIDGFTRRFVEFMADVPTIPERVDFFTGDKNEESDLATFLRAMAEAQKQGIHVDSNLTYDGSVFGLNASASVTPGATTGLSVTFTASAAVFLSSHVGKQIWKKAIVGVGFGRAEITTVNSSTDVTCKILSGADFDNTDAMPAGDWYLTTDTIINLGFLESREVEVIADGGKHPEQTVTGEVISLDYQSSVVHVGLGYEGFLQPMSLELGGITGTSQSKPKHIYQVGIRFLKSLGAEFGTNIYKPKEVLFSNTPLPLGGPDPLFTGIKKLPLQDDWEDDKVVYIRQNNPLPCNVQFLVLYGETDED